MVTVGPVTRENLPELASLYEELVGRPTNWAKMPETFAWMEANPDYILLGATVDGRLAGTLMGVVCKELVGECQPFLIIENVIIADEYRRMGIGRVLMEAIETMAKGRGCYLIQLVSSMHRKEAHRFYESMGYGLDVVQGFRKHI